MIDKMDEILAALLRIEKLLARKASPTVTKNTVPRMTKWQKANQQRAQEMYDEITKAVSLS